jgi:drug/metabolite transporter (DMT)-like permease
MNATLRAGIWMSGAIVSFSAMAVAGRTVSLDLDTFEIMMYRSLIGLVIVVTVAGACNTLTQISRNRLSLHLVRNLFHFAGQNLWFYALTVIPLAQVFALEFTSPIWVLLLSPIVLQERLNSTKIFAALIGFMGILIVTRPSPETLNIGQVTAALAAIGFAGSAVFTRLLTRTETITSILFWLTLSQAVFGLICAGADGDIAVPDLATWPWVALIALCGLVAHFCLTTALSLAPAAVVVPVDFTRLPIIALVGVALYAEPIDPMVILGAILIFGANYWNIWKESQSTTVTKT